MDRKSERRSGAQHLEPGGARRPLRCVLAANLIFDFIFVNDSAEVRPQPAGAQQQPKQGAKDTSERSAEEVALDAYPNQVRGWSRGTKAGFDAKGCDNTENCASDRKENLSPGFRLPLSMEQSDGAVNK